MAKFWRKHKFLIFTLIIIIGVGAVIFASSRNQPQRAIPDESLTTVTKRNVIRTVILDGSLGVAGQRRVTLPASSKIKEIRVGIGTQVSEGTILAVAEVTTGVRTRDVEIEAPISGWVSEINYLNGEIVTNPGQPGFVIVGAGPLQIEVSIPENSVTELAVGQPVKFTIPAIDLTNQITGKLTSIDTPPIINGSGRVSYRAIALPDSLPTTARWGMTADVEVTTAQVANVLAVPDSYLIERENKLFVRQVVWLDTQKTEYELKDVEITVGLRSDEFSELKTGATEGMILVDPAFETVREFNIFGGQ